MPEELPKTSSKTLLKTSPKTSPSKRKRISLILILTSICASMSLLMAGCTGDSASGGATGAEAATDVHIITSFYPMYIETINITRDIEGVSVTNMTKPQTGCLHDYSLTTSDMKNLENGDIFVINGAGMESFLEKVTSRMPDLKIVNASEGIELIRDEESGKENPHVWVSITGAIEQTRNIAGQLAVFDPAHSDKYASNADEYIRKLEELRTRMHNELDGLPNKDIVTFHEAFPYFAKEFNLNIKAVLIAESGDEPDAGQLAKVVDIVREYDIKALFTEPQYQMDYADTVARETGAVIYNLDPVVTGEADGDTDAYLKKMEENMNVLKEALGN